MNRRGHLATLRDTRGKSGHTQFPHPNPMAWRSPLSKPEPASFTRHKSAEFGVTDYSSFLTFISLQTQINGFSTIYFICKKAETRLHLKPFIIHNGFLRFSGAFRVTERPVIFCLLVTCNCIGSLWRHGSSRAEPSLKWTSPSPSLPGRTGSQAFDWGQEHSTEALFGFWKKLRMIPWAYLWLVIF